MNVEEYISSGILEAYAQGELSEQEGAAVETNLSKYPELRKELEAIEAVQESLLQRAAIQPRVAVRDALFAKIDERIPRSRVMPLTPPGKTVTRWKFAAAASLAIALISSYLAYDYWNKWKKTEESLTSLVAQNQRVANDYNSVNQRLDQIEKDLNVLDNPNFKRVVMKGTPNAPGSVAAVYWNESTKEVYLSVLDMKQLTAESQYQLWAIIDGKPVDAGVFDHNFAGLLKMKNISSGVATFAVTIEPRGGKEAPTLKTMQVAGDVVKG